MPRVNLEDLFVYDQWAVYARQLDRLESHLEQDLQSFEQWVEQQAKRIDDEDTLSQFYDFYSEEYHEHKEFKVILMNSLFCEFLCLVRAPVDADLSCRQAQFW